MINKFFSKASQVPIINKIIRMVKAFSQEIVRRLPYIVGILLVLLFITGWLSYQKTAEGVQIAKDNSNTIKEQGVDIKLLTEQNKQLSEQSNILASQNKAYIKCVATVFAKYTQDGRAVVIEDLERCVVTSLSIDTPPAQSTPTGRSPASSNTSQPQTNNKTGGGGGQSPKEPDPPKPPEPPKNEGLIPDFVPVIGPLL